MVSPHGAGVDNTDGSIAVALLQRVEYVGVFRFRFVLFSIHSIPSSVIANYKICWLLTSSDFCCCSADGISRSSRAKTGAAVVAATRAVAANAVSTKPLRLLLQEAAANDVVVEKEASVVRMVVLLPGAKASVAATRAARTRTILREDDNIMIVLF